MAMAPLQKPSNPCVADLNGMFVGKWIYVCGRIHQDADRFAINLSCGPEDGSDIALHFNPRFGANKVVRNTRHGGWGPEERDGPFFPFQQGKLFGITITCRKDGFEMRANRYKRFVEYQHRLPFHEISHVHVRGQIDITLVSCGIEGVDIPAQVWTNPSPGDFEIPFHNIRERTIVIVGVPTNDNGRMDINFVGKEGEGIHFHYNSRLNEQQIVRNTREPGVGWGGPEERDLDMPFPFKSGVPFETKIKVEGRRFIVEINGVFAFAYAKRLKELKKIRLLQIAKDVEIKKVAFY